MLKRAFKRLAIAIAAGVTMAVKTFADLEQGLIRVAKTTGMAGEELKAFKKEMENLAVSMTGISIKDIQSIAATAGQLGIHGTKNILSFTESIAQMGVATDLSAEEAATGMARLRVVLGEDISQIQRMGSVMNELSNNTTATAADILDLSLRMGGAAKTLELTTPEVMGLSAALRDVGVELQVGGTAMSQVMMQMLTNTEAFASASGMSLENYAAMIRNKPIDAIMALGESLGRMDKIARAATLETLGLTGIRTAGTLMKLADASQIVRKNIQMANDEWSRGTSLQIEYDTASKGLSSQLTTLKNVMVIVAGYIGEGLAPAIKNLITYVKENAEAIKAWAKTMGESLSRFAKWFIGDFIPTMVGAWNILRTAVYLVGEGIGRVLKIQAQAMVVLSFGLSKTAKDYLKIADEFVKECQRMRRASYDNVLAAKEWGDNLKAFLSTEEKVKADIDKTTSAVNNQTDAYNGVGDAIDDVIGKKKDMVSEFIGAFEFKPSAILTGGGKEFGTMAPSISQGAGGNTVLQLTVNVDTRAGLHRTLDRELDKLNAVN
jgi:TP901 family phage tail tape measure protein